MQSKNDLPIERYYRNFVYINIWVKPRYNYQVLPILDLSTFRQAGSSKVMGNRQKEIVTMYVSSILLEISKKKSPLNLTYMRDWPLKKHVTH